MECSIHRLMDLALPAEYSFNAKGNKQFWFACLDKGLQGTLELTAALSRCRESYPPGTSLTD